MDTIYHKNEVEVDSFADLRLEMGEGIGILFKEQQQDNESDIYLVGQFMDDGSIPSFLEISYNPFEQKTIKINSKEIYLVGMYFHEGEHNLTLRNLSKIGIKEKISDLIHLGEFAQIVNGIFNNYIKPTNNEVLILH